MTKGEITSNVEDQIHVRRGKVDSLSLYEVTDYELAILERGSPQSILLDFSISLLSIAISFLFSLLTTEIADERIFVVFVVVEVISFFLGVILLILWSRSRKTSSEIVNKIKGRIPISEVEKGE